jgi:hypothetical protein
MAKRKQRTSARKKMVSKRGKARTRAKPVPRKAAKRAGRKTKAEILAKRVAVKAKAKKQAIKPRAKSAALKKSAPRPTEPPRQPADAAEETVIVDIIEEPVPGVMVITEFESVRTSGPETPTPQTKSGWG